jgi:hypothetical protein
MNIIVDPDLKAYIDPLTPDEHAALERSLLSEGCRDALVLWGDVLVDGHNRYAICQQHGLPFQTVQNTRFQSMEDVHLWMIDQHLGRRSVSDFQRGVLALRKKDIVAGRRARFLAASPGQGAVADDPPFEANTAAAAMPPEDALNSREALARAARLSSNQIVMIEKVQKQAAPEVVAALKSGTISLNAAAAVASLPAQEQVAAATAGKHELKQAAKRVREGKRQPNVAPAGSHASAEADTNLSAEAQTPLVKSLQRRIAELTEQNDLLRQQVALLQAQPRA